MHHGYYGEDGKEQKDHTQAQADLARTPGSGAGVEKAGRILDAGLRRRGRRACLPALQMPRCWPWHLSPVQESRAGAEMPQRGCRAGR